MTVPGEDPSLRTQNLLRTVRLVLFAICFAFFSVIVYLGYLLIR